MDGMLDHFQKYPSYFYPKWWSWMIIVLSIIVFFGGLIGNALVCIALYRNGSMRTVTNYFLLNLAIADFMVILFCLPASITWDVTLTWLFGTPCCKVMVYLQTVSVSVSVLTLSFISMERWYAICFPLKFKSTIRRAKTAILIIWILALTLDIPELIVYESVAHNRAAANITITLFRCEPTWSRVFDKTWTVLKMICLYKTPLCIMGVMYYKIVKVLRKSERQLNSEEISDSTHLNSFLTTTNKKQKLKSRRKAAKMLACVVAMFAFCFLPVHIIEILRLTVQMKNSNLNRALSMLSHWLCYANSAVNPLIYNFMSNKFRMEFKKSFQCCMKVEKRGRYDAYNFHHAGSMTENRHLSKKLQQNSYTLSTKLSA